MPLTELNTSRLHFLKGNIPRHCSFWLSFIPKPNPAEIRAPEHGRRKTPPLDLILVHSLSSVRTSPTSLHPSPQPTYPRQLAPQPRLTPGISTCPSRASSRPSPAPSSELPFGDPRPGIPPASHPCGPCPPSPSSATSSAPRPPRPCRTPTSGRTRSGAPSSPQVSPPPSAPIRPSSSPAQRTIPRPPPERHGAARHRRVRQALPLLGHLQLRRVRRAAVHGGAEVRLGLWVARLLRRRAGRREALRGPRHGHGEDGDCVC